MPAQENEAKEGKEGKKKETIDKRVSSVGKCKTVVFVLFVLMKQLSID